MPALITHRLFGEESIERLPERIITNEDERAAPANTQPIKVPRGRLAGKRI